MKKKTAYRFGAILILVLVGTGIIIKTAVLNDATKLCFLAEGFDEPSRPYYFFVERIYKISNDSDASKKLLDYLGNKENLHLQNLVIRLLGVTGEREALPHLRRLLDPLKGTADNLFVMYYAIYSIGLIGDDRAVSLLENVLEACNSVGEIRTLGFPTAVALFILTGDTKHYFLNSAGERQTLIVTSRLSGARKVILQSKGRKRTYQEMITLDKIFRHPDW